MKAVRVFLTGAAVGLLAGVFLSPILTRADFAGGAVGDVVNGMLANAHPKPPMATWPTGDEALEALFELSNWTADAAQANSSVIVDDCLSYGDNIACKLTIKLSWVDGPKAAEAIFQKVLERWSMLSIRDIKAT